MFIGETIGDDYKEWQDGSTIFISSQTGSGKTTFILKELLPYAKEQNKRILYLVNRRVLKEQMENAIRDLPLELSKYIEIESYQSIEDKFLHGIQQVLDEQIGYNTWVMNCIKNKVNVNNTDTVNNMNVMNIMNTIRNMDLMGTMNNKDIIDIIFGSYLKYDYVVCDEAHYFLMDSNYNTNTILSYKMIRKLFFNKIRIFISATIDDIQQYIEEDDKSDFKNSTWWYNYKYGHNDVLRKKEHFNYSQNPIYDYIDVKVIYDLQELEDLIVKGTGKWLVFVDNKEFGSTLRKSISEVSKKEEIEVSVSFVTADYMLDDDANTEVNNIVLEKKQSAKVLIATSVLDNGINIKDLELRNIVILADTKTEFLQMLGRKRQDGEKVKVYIYQQSRNHFVKRKRIADRRKQLAKKICNDYEKSMWLQIKADCDEKGDNSKYAQENNEIEMRIIKWIHKFLLNNLINSQMRYDDIKALFLAIDGTFYLNKLSVSNIDNLSQFYDKIIHQFETDGKDAFVKEQFRWLGKTEEEIEGILKDSKKTYYDKCRDKVIEEFKRKVNIPLSKAEIIQLKNSIQTELKGLVEHVGEEHVNYQKYIDLVRKNDRPISDKFIDFLREECKIPFTMHVQNGIYTIENFQK